MKQAMKDWLREAMQHQTGSLSSLMLVLRVSLERAGRWPAVGPICLRWAGFIHGIQGRHAQAITLYQAALDGGLRHPSLHYNLGQSLLKTGQATQAETEFARS